MPKVSPGRYTPINPVALSTSHAAPNYSSHESPAVSALSGDNSTLMKMVASLWICEGDTVVDVTWGKGVFWKQLPGLPTFAHDLKTDGVDCRKLPHEDNSVDVLVLDPPYRPTHGSKSFDNSFAGSYGLGTNNLDTINDVVSLYREALLEAKRVVRPGGRVLIKCQDLSYGNRLHLVSLDVLGVMLEQGFEFADQFILVNNANHSSGNWERQGRARRSHSILWVGVSNKQG